MTEHERITRRRFIECTAAGAAITLAQPFNTAARDDGDHQLIIDCHAHIYGQDEKKYPTIT